LKRDHRPYLLKKLDLKIQAFYLRHFLKPQLEQLGKNATFIQPWHVELFGPSIRIGDCATVVAARDKKVRLSVWPKAPGKGEINIGNYCLISPGVRIGSATGISIGDNSMVAGNAYLTDSDWHGIYNRVSPGEARPIVIKENVWIGDSAIVCKGVTIGKNSIVGAGSVVTKDIPANTIAAGNPARVVKQLDPDRDITPRSSWFSNPEKLNSDIEIIDRDMLKKNTLVHWLRHALFPRKGE
jgi:acetyltransferase-like isoleucine patch superfamily enzyme